MTIEDYYNEAKSWCYCGHLGDGPSEDVADPMWRSQHAGINGHGPCNVEGCECMQFTWKGFTERFQGHLNERSEND